MLSQWYQTNGQSWSLCSTRKEYDTQFFQIHKRCGRGYNAFHKTFDRLFAKFVVNLIISPRAWEFQYVTVNQMTNLGISCRTLWECGEVISPLLSGCCFEMSAFAVKGKAIPCFAPPKIIESWLRSIEKANLK